MVLPSAGLTKGLLQLFGPCSAQVLSALLSPPADMMKDVIREYDEHFPEIIERATYTLEKVGECLGSSWWCQSCRGALSPAAP